MPTPRTSQAPRLARIARTAQKGFTLIELVVVVAILGVLAALVVPKLAGSKDGATGRLLQVTAQSAVDNWRLVAQTCGLPTTVAANAGLATGMKVEDVIFTGESALLAAYQPCYRASKVLPLSEVGSGGAGAYTVGNYAIAIAGGGTSPITVTYSAVPDTIVLDLAQLYNPALTQLAASDVASPVLQYGTVTAGARNLTFRKRIV